MTHIVKLNKLERMALALGYHGETRQIKRIPRNLIMQVRRLAVKNYTTDAIIAELKLDMCSAAFRRECKRLEIKLRNKGRTKHENASN